MNAFEGEKVNERKPEETCPEITLLVLGRSSVLKPSWSVRALALAQVQMEL